MEAIDEIGGLSKLEALGSYWRLPIAVLVGGCIGSFPGARRMPAGAVKKVAGALIFVVALWPLCIAA